MNQQDSSEPLYQQAKQSLEASLERAQELVVEARHMMRELNAGTSDAELKTTAAEG